MLNAEWRKATSFRIPHSSFCILVFPFPEYCHDFHDKACQDQDGGQGDAFEAEHFLVEHIGVSRPASNHQDEAHGDEDEADENEDVVHFAERQHFLVVILYCCFLCWFFCHMMKI